MTPAVSSMPPQISRNDWTIVPMDALLTLEEAAALWRLQPEALSAKSKGKRAQIPGIWLNQRLVRFHPRIMLAKAAYDAGVPVEVITAAFNIKLAKVDGVDCFLVPDSATSQNSLAEYTPA